MEDEIKKRWEEERVICVHLCVLLKKFQVVYLCVREEEGRKRKVKWHTDVKKKNRSDASGRIIKVCLGKGEADKSTVEIFFGFSSLNAWLTRVLSFGK
jgi:hypothetical protein